MTTRKNSLAASMADMDIKPTPAAKPVAVEAEATPPEPTDIETARKPTVSKGRVGKKAIQGYFDPAVGKQLNQLALDEDTTVQALLAEALDDLFNKRGKPPIAR